MPVKKTNKKTPTPPTAAETDFLKTTADKLININQQLDLRAYPTLAIASLIFVFSLFNILDSHQKGLIGFMAIALGSVFSVMISWYALRATSLSYNQIVLGQLDGESPESLQGGLSKMLKAKAEMAKTYYWQVYELNRISNTKKKYLDAALSLMVLSLMVGLILIVALP